MNKKIIIGILILVLIIVMGVVIAYKLIEDSVTNREDFKFNVENISSNPVNTISHEQNITNGENTSNTENNENPISTENANRKPENVTIEIDNSTINTESVSITITDNNENHYGWGVEFRVQEKVNGEWKDLKYISDNLSWIDIAYQLNEDNKLTQKLDIEKYYGKLNNAIYRVVKPGYDNEYVAIYSNEYKIT